MDIPNYVAQTLIKDKSFIREMTESSEKLFSSIDSVFFAGTNREVKVLRSNECIYVFDKHDKKLTVHWEQIETFEHDKTTEQILHYTTKRLEEYEAKQKSPDFDVVRERNGELYLMAVYGSKTSEYLEQIHNGTYKEEYKPTSLEEEVERARASGVSEAFITRILALAPIAAKEINLHDLYSFSCTNHVDILRDYTRILNDREFLATKYPDSFFKGLNSEGYPIRDDKLPHMWDTINYFIDVSKANNLDSYSNAIRYNDSDNAIFMHGNHLIVSDQTCGYYFDIKDKGNYKVYFLEKEYKGLEKEIDRIELALKNNTIDPLKDIVLEVKNDKTQYQNDVFMYVLDLCFQYGPRAIKESGLKTTKPKNKIR